MKDALAQARDAHAKATKILSEGQTDEAAAFEMGLALPYLDQVGAAIEQLSQRDALATRLANMIRELHLAEGREVTDEECLDLLIGGSQADFVRLTKAEGRARLADVMARLYRSEINCEVSTQWDGGWDVKLGDPLNGYKAEWCIASPPWDSNPVVYMERLAACLQEVADWFHKNAVELFPESLYAQQAAA